MESQKSALTPTDDQKVNLTLYYETLNPDSALFLVEEINGVFDNDLITILNLRLVPWGKAYTNKSDNAILCQVVLYLSLAIFFIVKSAYYVPYIYISLFH